jgi:hypothetical protein
MRCKHPFKKSISSVSTRTRRPELSSSASSGFVLGEVLVEHL